MTPLQSSDLPLPVFRRGKIRDVYDLGERLLIVATDRVSAFDCIMSQGIPDKGRILTQVAAYWFGVTADLVPNHLIATDVAALPTGLEPFHDILAGRSMLVQRTRPLAVECVVRGYIAGSGWKDYRATGAICGIPLPAGLQHADRLPEPIFTPTTKAEEGHDEAIDFGAVESLVGSDLAAQLRDVSIALYHRGSELARERGILLADTKFEFGVLEDGRLILIDEALTPDSSRYWLADTWRPGSNPPSLDKQFLRDYLEGLQGWNKQPPPPPLPQFIIDGVRERYLDLARRFSVPV